MKRREFIALFGGAAAAWPLTARAQQSIISRVGLMNILSPEVAPDFVPAFRQGLKRMETTVNYQCLQPILCVKKCR
jgi:putative tryptophan/tyrosine transport system substrate-binding protein